jgi:hypothetical protein
MMNNSSGNATCEGIWSPSPLREAFVIVQGTITRPSSYTARAARRIGLRGHRAVSFNLVLLASGIDVSKLMELMLADYSSSHRPFFQRPNTKL